MLLNTFSKIIIISIILTSSIRGQVILRDSPRYRVGNRLVLKSELSEMKNDFNRFECIFPKSKFLSFFPRLKKVFADKKHVSLIQMEKVLSFVKGQNVRLDLKVKNSILALSKSDRCNVLTEKKRPLLWTMFKTEIYVQSRFNEKSLWLNADKKKKNNSKELSRKIQESFDIFILSLDSQIEHEAFF